VLNIDDANVLRVAPFTALGTPVQLIKAFGGRQDFEHQLRNYWNKGATAKIERRRATGDSRVKIKPAPKPSQLPMPLSHGWAVQSFENPFLFIDYRGSTPPKTNEGIPLVTAKNVRPGYLNREPREYVSTSTVDGWMTRGLPRPGDIFYY
jgi:hypothetical protein